MLLLASTLGLHAQSYTMDGSPIDDCQGFFQDSGGGSGNYGTNENFTTVICSDGSEGTHIQLIFSSIDIGPLETIAFYDAPTADPAAQLDASFLQNPENPFIVQATAANTSGCITIVFTSDAIDTDNTGWSADINCVAACQIITSDLVSTLPEVMPVDTGWIDICPGDRVTFNGAGLYPQNGLVYNHSDATSTFEWDFGNGTAVGPNVTNVYEEPGGYIVQLKITDQFGCENTNFISQRIRVSPYPAYQFDGALDPTICSGDSIMITSSIDTAAMGNVTVSPGMGSFVQAGVRSDTLLLPDGSGGQYEESIGFTQFRPGATLTNPADICAVTLDLEHSYSGDLDIELICPDGTSIFLLEFPSGLGSTNFGEPFASAPVDGQSGDLTPGIPYTYSFEEGAPNGTLEQFDGSAPTYPSYTTVPSINNGNTYTYNDTYFPEGAYQPEESYSNLLGCPLNGDWTIRVTDNLGLDNGWLFEWSITFKDYLFPNVETFSPTFVDYNWVTNPTVISASPDSVMASPINAGVAAYTFFVEDSFGCYNDTTLNFEVLPPTHPDCYNCNLDFEEQEDVVLCEGETADLDLSQLTPVQQAITFERFPQYALGAANHPPGNPYRSPLNVNSISPTIITNPLTDIVSVCFSLNTDFAADVNVVLASPNGTQLPLSISNGGGSNLGYVNTCFTPTSLTSINGGSPPYTGQFQPEGNWNTLIGSPINGEWELLITDAFGPLQFGELLEWSITFNNENEYTYSWTPTAGLSCTDCPTPTANPAATTLYEVLVEDQYACSRLDSVLVAVVADVPVPTVTCSEQGFDLLFSWDPIPGVTEYEYNIILPSGPQGWTGPTTDLQILVDNLANGDEVTVEVRPFFSGNSNNCPIESGSATCISSFCSLNVDLLTLTDVSCYGLTDGEAVISITGGEAPYNISLDGVNTADPIFTDLAAGDYTYTVTDNLGCEVVDLFTINTPDSLFANASQTFQSCAGLDQSEATVMVGGGSGTYTYAWSNGDNTASLTDLPVGALEVTVTDNAGCEVVATTEITELAPVSFNFIAVPPTCNGFSDGRLGINNVMGGLGMDEDDYLFVWEDGSQESVRLDVPGGMVYSVTVSDAQGCSSSQQRTVIDPEPVDFDFAAVEPSCNGYDDGELTIVNPSGPNGSVFTYQWGAAAGNQTTANVAQLTAGTYVATIQDEEGCEATQSVTLDQPLGLSVDFSIKNNDCFGYDDGSVAVTVTGGVPGYSFSWPNGSTQGVREGLIAGAYEITITDANGCSEVRTATVTEPVALVATVETQDVSCFGERDGVITINTEGGTPPFRFSLDDQNFTSSNVLIGLFGGDYNVFIQDANGCQFLSTATVVEPDEFMVNAGVVGGGEPEFIFGDSIQLTADPVNAQGEVEFVWEGPYAGTLGCNECTEPWASPDYTIDYEVYAIDENGCEDTDRIRIFVLKPKLAVVPTGFTPNGDFFNDRLLVHGRPGTQVVLFQIFDRWGEMVYSEGDFPVNDPDTGWDGTFRGELMNSGVFVWSLTVLHEDGTEETLRGQTTLIR